MNELALFAGAGGGILGGELLGWRTVCAVEIADYCRRVLLARQDDGCLPPFPIWDDVRTFDGKPWRGLVDIITGGFPCQDISAAGHGAGITGSRSGLWSEFARIIREVGPRFVLVENSPILTSRGLGRVLGDLAAMGYDARWGVLGAVAAGAPHKRERIWIVADCSINGRRAGWPGGSDSSDQGKRECSLQVVADSERIGQPTESNGILNGPPPSAQETDKLEGGREMADPSRFQPRRPEQRPERERTGEGRESIAQLCDTVRARLEKRQSEPGDNGAQLAAAIGANWWEFEPAVGRVAHGVASRVDRLRCLGNGQVPAVVRLAWHFLHDRNHLIP